MLRVELNSPPDRPRLVAAIMCDNLQIAEIRDEDGVPRMESYSKPDGSFWDVDYDEFRKATEEAWRRLQSRL